MKNINQQIEILIKIIKNRDDLAKEILRIVKGAEILHSTLLQEKFYIYTVKQNAIDLMAWNLDIPDFNCNE